MMLHLGNQHDVTLGAGARQARGHAVETCGGAAAGKERTVVLRTGVDKFEYFFVGPIERRRSAARRVMQIGMGAGIVFQELVAYVIGRRHHQRGSGRIQINAGTALTVDGRILGIAPNKFSLKTGQKFGIAHWIQFVRQKDYCLTIQTLGNRLQRPQSVCIGSRRGWQDRLFKPASSV